jgi:thiamine pyrophosphate-dependent acetolactate synthase large subunit-like protein
MNNLFKNADFVKYAESFGAKGYRVERAADLTPLLKQALADAPCRSSTARWTTAKI